MSNQQKGRLAQMTNEAEKAQQAAAAEGAKSTVTEQQSTDSSEQAVEKTAPTAPVTEQSQEPAVQEQQVESENTTEQADKANATAIVQETTTLATAATSSLSTRGTIAPPRVRRDNGNEQKTVPSLPNTMRTTEAQQSAPTLQEEMQRILKDVPPTNHFPIYAVVEYCQKADLKRSNDAKTLAQLNVGLWRNLTNLINRQEEHFDPLFTALLRIFHLEAKNSMSEIAVNRGIEYMSLPKQDLSGYMNITTLLRLVADPKSRKQMIKTGVNVSAALRNGLTQEGAARVIAYFETH